MRRLWAFVLGVAVFVCTVNVCHGLYGPVAWSRLAGVLPACDRHCSLSASAVSPTVTWFASAALSSQSADFDFPATISVFRYDSADANPGWEMMGNGIDVVSLSLMKLSVCSVNNQDYPLLLAATASPTAVSVFALDTSTNNWLSVAQERNVTSSASVSVTIDTSSCTLYMNSFSLDFSSTPPLAGNLSVDSFRVGTTVWTNIVTQKLPSIANETSIWLDDSSSKLVLAYFLPAMNRSLFFQFSTPNGTFSGLGELSMRKLTSLTGNGRTGQYYAGYVGLETGRLNVAQHMSVGNTWAALTSIGFLLSPAADPSGTRMLLGVALTGHVVILLPDESSLTSYTWNPAAPGPWALVGDRCFTRTSSFSSARLTRDIDGTLLFSCTAAAAPLSSKLFALTVNDDPFEKLLCRPGQYYNSTDCTPCPMGHMCPFHNGSAEACPQGYFGDTMSALYCKQCPTGSFSPDLGAHACRACTSLGGKTSSCSNVTSLEGCASCAFPAPNEHSSGKKGPPGFAGQVQDMDPMWVSLFIGLCAVGFGSFGLYRAYKGIMRDNSSWSSIVDLMRQRHRHNNRRQAPAAASSA